MATDTASSASQTALTADDDPRDRGAGIRIVRLAASFVSVGYLAYGIVAAPVISDSTSVMATWWTVPAVAAIFVPGLLLGVLAWRLPPRGIRLLASVAVLGHALVIATWWFGWDGRHFNTTTGIWFSMFFGVTGLAAAVAFPARYAFLTLVGLATSCILINHQIRPPELNMALVPDIAWGIGFSLVFVAAGTMVVRTAGLLDSTRAQALSASARAAAAHARSIERAQFDALTHDSVMATLLLAARSGTTAEITQHARSAIAAIDRAAALGNDPTIGIDDGVAQIVAAARLVGPDVTVTVESLDNAATVPDSVVSALAAATSEAVRNSVLHAGPATVSVTIEAGGSRLTVTVEDDGVGFDAATVRPARFGIALSIKARMARLPGGRADVTSVLGAGTRVRLEWRR